MNNTNCDIKYFVYGYLNRILTNKSGYGESYGGRSAVKSIQVYLGLSDSFTPLLKILLPILPITDFFVSILFLVYKFLKCLVLSSLSKKKQYNNLNLCLNLNFPKERALSLFNIIQNKQLTFISIPFVRNNMKEFSSVSVLNVLPIKDIFLAFFKSFRTIILMHYRYGINYQLFRAHSSFEYYLLSLFVLRCNNTNRFIYFSLIDRWAYLLANDRNHDNILIQHGSLINLPFVKMKAPREIYYINEEQKKLLETVLFSSLPQISSFRPNMIFNSYNKLVNNGKINILLVCCPKYIEQERKIISGLCSTFKYNLYIKKHPGFKNDELYDKLKANYTFYILDKYDYPKVDIVISYDSTLAIEYADAGVEVHKYSDLNFDDYFEGIIQN